MEDDWFSSLPPSQRYFFIYLFTNTHIGLSGIYQLSERLALLETGATREEWDLARDVFSKAKKVMFYKDWIYIVNSYKYSNYAGEKNRTALLKEVSLIPEEVIHIFGYSIDRLPYSIDTSINHKSKIINKKRDSVSIEYQKDKAVLIEKLGSAKN